MAKIRQRTLVIALIGGLATVLSIGAVAPVAAADDPNDAAVLQAAATLNGSYGSVAIGYPGPIYTATSNSGYNTIAVQGVPTPYYAGVVPPAVRFDPSGETSGTYQIDYSAAD